MKKPKPTKHIPVVFDQLCKLIPVGLVSPMAKEYGVDKKSRTFSPWSHVVSLLYCQLTHCIGLNDLCDWGIIARSCSRYAVPRSRAGTDSRMRTSRNAEMMEALFWQMLDHIQNPFPGFGPAGRYKGLTRRFNRIYAIG